MDAHLLCLQKVDFEFLESCFFPILNLPLRKGEKFDMLVICCILLFESSLSLLHLKDPKILLYFIFRDDE